MARNILLTIAYDGTNFSGWQRQPGLRTVCGTIEEVLSVIFKGPIKIDGTSRTDAGVHALGQQASFLAPDWGIPAERIPLAVNTLLAEDRVEYASDIRILDAKEMPEDFHARFSAKGKRYIYKIYNCQELSVFRRTQFYQITKPLDVCAMQKAARLMLGTHDFAAFQSAGSTPRETTVRTMQKVEVSPKGEDGYIEICVEGDAFLYNMVRIMVGTLVEIGQGRRSEEALQKALQTGDRKSAGHIAPAQGLYLAKVFY